MEAWNCKPTLKSPKLTNVTYIENSFTKACSFVGYDPALQEIIISSRGSCNARNWIEDFNFEVEPYFRCEGCFIHAGFYSDYLLNEKKMEVSVKNIMASYRVRRIVSTGHSLGAALSSIIGIEFAKKYPDIPVYIHNFGSPRIGNKKLAEYVEKTVK